MTEILWCKKHESTATGQTERCEKVLAAALRIGLNPFDPYNSRRFGGKCDLVEARVLLGCPHDDCVDQTLYLIEQATMLARYMESLRREAPR